MRMLEIRYHAGNSLSFVNKHGIIISRCFYSLLNRDVVFNCYIGLIRLLDRRRWSWPQIIGKIFVSCWLVMELLVLNLVLSSQRDIKPQITFLV